MTGDTSHVRASLCHTYVCSVSMCLLTWLTWGWKQVPSTCVSFSPLRPACPFTSARPMVSVVATSRNDYSCQALYNIIYKSFCIWWAKFGPRAWVWHIWSKTKNGIASKKTHLAWGWWISTAKMEGGKEKCIYIVLFMINVTKWGIYILAATTPAGFNQQQK